MSNEYPISVIKKKLWREYYDDVASGRKKYELHLTRFELAEDDTIMVKEWSESKKKYTGGSTFASRPTAEIQAGRFWKDASLGRVDRYGPQILTME